MSVPSEEEVISSSLEEVELTAGDIPRAELSEPLDKHPVAALRWWLLCRGIKVPNIYQEKGPS